MKGRYNKKYRNLKTGRTLDNIAEILNDEYLYQYYDRLKRIALNRFEWLNLPETCNERMLEETLFEHGLVGFINDKNLGIIHGKATGNGKINFYGDYTGYMLIGANADNIKVNSIDDIVLCRNTQDGRSISDVLMYYANKLAMIERTIDININAQKTPVLITGTENNMDSLKELYQKYNGSHPVIYANESFNADMFNVLSTEAPYIVDKLRQEKRDIWNECLTFLGVSNVDINKKERLITDEAESNNEIIAIGIDLFYKWRVEAVNELNKKFDLNVEVKVRNSLQSVYEEKEKEDNSWNMEDIQ